MQISLMVATFSLLYKKQASKKISKLIRSTKYSQEPDHGAKNASTWEQPNRKRGDHIQPGHIGWHLRGKFASIVTRILPSNADGWDRPIQTLRSNP